jgi:predicted HTH domain antitoxin
MCYNTDACTEGKTMSVVISDDILKAARMSEDELKREIAILLYQQKKLSTGKARRLAGMHLIEFRRELSRRGICVNYDVEDFQTDLKNLREWGDL